MADPARAPLLPRRRRRVARIAHQRGAIVVLALFVTGFVSRGVGALLRRRGVEDGVRFGVVKILRYVLIVTGFFVAASSIGIRLDAVIAASAALAVGIGFGLQNVAQNFVSGVILLVEQPVRKGDFVRVGDASGTVEDVGLRATRVVTRDEVSIIVPNSQFITEAVTNFTRPTRSLRIHVAVGVAYGTDIARAAEALVGCAAGIRGVLEAPAPEVRLERSVLPASTSRSSSGSRAHAKICASPPSFASRSTAHSARTGFRSPSRSATSTSSGAQRTPWSAAERWHGYRLIPPPPPRWPGPGDRRR